MNGFRTSQRKLNSWVTRGSQSPWPAHSRGRTDETDQQMKHKNNVEETGVPGCKHTNVFALPTEIEPGSQWCKTSSVATTPTRLINNPVYHGDSGWPPGLSPCLFAMKRPDITRQAWPHARVFSPTLIPKKDNRNSKKLKQRRPQVLLPGPPFNVPHPTDVSAHQALATFPKS